MMYAHALEILAGQVAINIALNGIPAAAAVIGTAIVIGGVVCFVTYEYYEYLKNNGNSASAAGVEQYV